MIVGFNVVTRLEPAPVQKNIFFEVKSLLSRRHICFLLFDDDIKQRHYGGYDDIVIEEVDFSW